MRVLFISRAFPPVIGGIEKQNYEISKALSQKTEVKLVVNRHGKKLLMPFCVFALYRIFRLRNQYDLILLGDGVLTILAWITKLFSRVPVVCIVHGLDVTYSNFIYRKCWLQFFFRSVDKFIAVGNETIRQAELRSVDIGNFVFVPNGVDTKQSLPSYSRADLENFLAYKPEGAVLLTLGRLVKRKGVLWFVEHVFPYLDASVTYLIAGTGSDEKTIKQKIAHLGVSDRVKLLGQVTDKDKKLLLSTADIFIQPNIRIENDIEGFGLVVLEAGLFGRPVLASKIEGLQDAIKSGQNGLLLEPENAGQYIKCIEQLLADRSELEAMGARAHDFVKNHYSWDSIANEYLRILKNIKKSGKG